MAERFHLPPTAAVLGPGANVVWKEQAEIFHVCLTKALGGLGSRSFIGEMAPADVGFPRNQSLELGRRLLDK